MGFNKRSNTPANRRAGIRWRLRLSLPSSALTRRIAGWSSRRWKN